MNLLTKTLLTAALATAATLPAQTQLVRGDVDGIRNTQGLFQLDCTQIPLVSNTVNLQQLHDQSRQQDIEYELQVVNIGTPAAPRLDVISANVIPEMFQMGNLRFGRSETWEVLAAPNSQLWILVDARVNTGYLPLGAAGTWVLGPSAVPFAQGATNAFGRFQTRFTMPTLPALVGQEITGQAVIQDGAGFLISNPDCKEVRNG